MRLGFPVGDQNSDIDYGDDLEPDVDTSEFAADAPVNAHSAQRTPTDHPGLEGARCQASPSPRGTRLPLRTRGFNPPDA